MPPELLPDIRRETLPDGERFILPRRPVTPGNRRGAAVLYGVSIVFGGFMLLWIGGAIGVGTLIEGEMPSLFALFFALLGIPGLIAALLPACFATLLIRGHSEVEVTSSTLRASERAGFFRWSGKRPVAAVRQLKVGNPMALRRQYDGRPPVASGDGDLAAIQVLCDTGRPMLMAVGYPLAMVKPLADVIAAKVGAPGRVRGAAAPVVAVVESVEETDADEQPARDDPVPDQPLGSMVTVDRRADGVTITVPPAGIRAGSAGLFGFGCLWTGFMVIVTIAVIFGEPGRGGDDVWIAWLVIPLFWCVGLGMLLAGVNMGRRMAIIDITGDMLLITHKSLFGVRQQHWQAGELADIRFGPSGMKSNKTPIMQVRIVPHHGAAAGYFTGRADDELRWLAAVLREELGLSAAASRE